MSVPFTHCLLAPFGLAAIGVFVIYVVAVLLSTAFWIRRAVRVDASLSKVRTIGRRDLPQGDIDRLPESLRKSSMCARAAYTWDGAEYETSHVSVWDIVGLSNYSKKVSDVLQFAYENEKKVDVLVDPKHPDRSLLTTSIRGFGLMEVGIGILCVVITALFTAQCWVELSAKGIAAATSIGVIVGAAGVVGCRRKAAGRK